MSATPEHVGQGVHTNHGEKKGFFDRLRVLRQNRWLRRLVAGAVVVGSIVQPEWAIAGVVVMGTLWAQARQEAKSH